MERSVVGACVQIARALRQAERLLPGLLYRAERENLRDAKTLAQQLSSGPYQPRTLAQLGHPYARRRFRPPAPAFIINRVTGSFWRGWRIVGPHKDGSGGYSSSLKNVAPQAAFLTSLGTKYMGPRPIQERIQARIGRAREDALGRALQQALLESLIRMAWKSFSTPPRGRR